MRWSDGGDIDIETDFTLPEDMLNSTGAEGGEKCPKCGWGVAIVRWSPRIIGCSVCEEFIADTPSGKKIAETANKMVADNNGTKEILMFIGFTAVKE